MNSNSTHLSSNEVARATSLLQIVRSSYCDRRLQTLLLISILVSAASAGISSGDRASVAPAVTCDGNWRTTITIDPAHAFGDYDSLNGVTALAPDNVWGVGQYHVFATGAYDQTLVEHWDGKAWSVVPTPKPAKKINLFSAVAAPGPNDIWAVGYERDTGIGAPYLTLIEHWDGNSWSIIQDGSYLGVLNNVFALASDDVWAVGSTNFPGSGVIEHWDGTSWTYTQISSSAEFRSVAGLASNDVWAVGQTYASNGGEDTLAMHFDGTTWTVVTTPNPLHVHPGYDENWLTYVTPIIPTEVWIMALWRDTDYGTLDHTFSLRGNENGWDFVPTQNPGGKSMYNDLWASVALTADNIWAVGSTGQITFAPLIENWNGTNWQVVSSPSLQGVLMALSRVPTPSTATQTLVASGNQVVGSGNNVYNGTLAEYACFSSAR